MSWATNSVSEATRQLSEVVTLRCQGEDPPPQVEVVRTPAALLFMRGDRTEPGASLAKQIPA